LSQGIVNKSALQLRAMNALQYSKKNTKKVNVGVVVLRSSVVFKAKVQE